FVVLAGRCVEEVVPSIPECLRIPVHPCADASGEIEADDSFIRVANTGRLTGFTGRTALLACESEHADAHGSDVETDAAEDRFARIIVEESIGPTIPRTVDGKVLFDAAAVDEPDRDVERAGTAVEDHAAIVGDPSGSISVEVLEREPHFAGEHQVGHLELPELCADAGAEHIIVS